MKKLRIMRKSILKIIAISLLFMSSMFAQQRVEKPNIIYILADDLGYSELECYGNNFNETPNLDQLAKEGVRFTHAYAAAPVCSPYRAALMTGQYPKRHGINDYLRPHESKFLDLSYTTLPEKLLEHGYHTGIIGKWHLSGYTSAGAVTEALPDKHGFKEVIISETAGIANGSFYYPYHFNPGLKKKLSGNKEFLIERMNFEAVDFIKRNKDKPFFLYLSHYGVHTMLHGKKNLVEKYQQKSESGKSNSSDNNPENNFYKKWPKNYFAKMNNPHLAAQLETIDEGVAMIRSVLEKYDLAENTIIIFTSDNGGELRVTKNTPLRGGKSELYEGGIRVPLIVYQPNIIHGGRIIEDPTANYDFYPTICDLVAISNVKNNHFDGISILPELMGKKKLSHNERTFYWHYPLQKKHFLGGRSSGAIRKGDWKLIEFFDDSSRELYNLKTDPSEEKNLFNTNPEMVDNLQTALIKWRREVLYKPKF
jgi:arylsulfatase A-like enzyme